MSGTIILATFLIAWVGFAIYARLVLRKSLTIALGGGFLVGALSLMPFALLSEKSKPSDNSSVSNDIKTSTPEKTKAVITSDNTKKISVTASEATDEYQLNKLAAKSKYSNPTIIIGTLYKIDEKPYDKQKRVQLSFENDSNPFMHLTATLADASEQREIAKKLSKKDFVRVECREYKYGVLAPDFENCVLLPIPKVNDSSVSAVEVDAVAMAIDLKGSKENIKKHFGSVAQVKLFVERFETDSGIKRLIDGNSGFFCDIDPLFSSSFPNQRGSYVVKGILVVSEGKVGLSKCQFVSN